MTTNDTAAPAPLKPTLDECRARISELRAEVVKRIAYRREQIKELYSAIKADEAELATFLREPIRRKKKVVSK